MTVSRLSHTELRQIANQFVSLILDGKEEDQHHDVDNPDCNCYECLFYRAKDRQTEFLLDVVCPEWSTIPRNYNVDIHYNDFRGDWRFSTEIDEVMYYLVKKINRIQCSNSDLQKYEKDHGRSTASWKYCFDCGVIHKRTKANTHTLSGKKVSFCDSCVKKYTTCDKCNSVTKTNTAHKMYKDPEVYNKVRNDLIRVDKQHYDILCHTCYSDLILHVCNFCGYIGVEDNMVINERNKVCTYCHNIYAKECNICNNISYDTDFDIFDNPPPENHNFVCYNCKQARKVYHDHTYRPSIFNFMTSKSEGKRDTKKDLFFGFELEIESATSWISNREAMAALVVEKIGANNIYCVHDGTLQNGIEIVTHPFTWEHYRTVGKNMWDELLLFCRSYEWSANSYGDGKKGPGFHIHTTKAAWGTYQLYKLLQLAYNRENRDFFIKIAGRKPTRFCSINPTDIKEAPIVAKGKKNRAPDHYAMINLNSSSGDSSNTVEFRLFAGSLEPLIVHKNIEFVRACYLFTRDFSLKNMNHKRLIVYIKANQKQYPHLCEYLTMKGI